MIRGFLKLDDVAGESNTTGHEDEIDLFGIHWSVGRADKAKPGAGRTQSRADIDAMHLTKLYDAASPQLALSSMNGKSYPEAVITMRKDRGPVHLDYLVITLSNVTIAEYVMESDEIEGEIVENIAIAFEEIEIKYTVQADDHSAGNAHEIKFDVAAGV